MKWLWRGVKHVLTREVEGVYFSDGDFFFGSMAVPEKPPGIVRERMTVRVWRWRRV